MLLDLPKNVGLLACASLGYFSIFKDVWCGRNTKLIGKKHCFQEI